MKEKLTREMVVSSIIRLINEHREGCVGEDAQLGRIHIGCSTVSWMYDWLKEEYDWAGMKIPTEAEIKSLRQGDTVGKLAEIAMRHCNADAEREVEDPHEGKLTKTVEISMASPKDGIGAHRDPVAMTREEFLKACGEFYDNRGTHCDDFEVMQVKISAEGAK